MNIWRVLGTLLATIGLMELTLGKPVTNPEGASLGIAADIKLDLAQGKIWIVIDNQKQWSIISTDQIIGLTDKVILSEDWLAA